MSPADNHPAAPENMPPHDVPPERHEEEKKPPEHGDGKQIDDNQDDLGKDVNAPD